MTETSPCYPVGWTIDKFSSLEAMDFTRWPDHCLHARIHLTMHFLHLLRAMQPVSFVIVYSVFMLGFHAMLIQQHRETWFFDCSCTML